MKSYNVDDKLKDRKIIKEAIEKICKKKKKGKKKKGSNKKYKQAQEILQSIEEYTDKILEAIIAFEKVKKAQELGIEVDAEILRKAYKPRKCKPFVTKENPDKKERKITSAPLYLDQIVHQLLVEIMKPIMKKYMYRHSYGSIPKGGTHAGKRYVKKIINHHTKHDKSAIKYVAKTDIQGCYGHVQHTTLKKRLRKKFRGKLFIWLAFEVIDSYHDEIVDGEKVGIPIGYSTSHWFCNFYLTPLDYYVKQKCNITYYVRYMDDKVFFGRNKKQLHKVVRNVMQFLKKFGMKLKYNWQIFRFDYIDRFCKRRGRDIDYLGFRFYRDKIILRKRNSLKIRRQALKISKSKKITARTAQSFMSRIGQLRHCNSFNFYQKAIKPYVNIKKLKGVIRNASRKQCKAQYAV